MSLEPHEQKWVETATGLNASVATLLKSYHSYLLCVYQEISKDKTPFDKRVKLFGEKLAPVFKAYEIINEFNFAMED